MKKTIVLVLIHSLVLLAACKKHTTFSGSVLSSDGNLPIEGAEVEIHFQRGAERNQIIEVGVDRMTTSSDGSYTLDTRTYRADYGILSVSKNGYAVLDQLIVQPGDCEERDFILHPYDAWLSVTFENTGSSEQQYYHYYSGKFFDEINYCMGSCGPLKLAPNEQRTLVAFIPGGAETDVYWDYQYNGGEFPLRYKTTTFCPRHDTTYVHIKI